VSLFWGYDLGLIGDVAAAGLSFHPFELWEQAGCMSPFWGYDLKLIGDVDAARLRFHQFELREQAGRTSGLRHEILCCWIQFG
jgi:hypothetical protein